ncbi:MAG: DUF2793 domain-containing protein [Chitinispirillaceae bacterium]|nr:DUF2793 domain-containing protein [Chitinispirillaceae bacterium]
MSAATLRESIIDQARLVQAAGRVYQAPAAWEVPAGAEYSPGKAYAECLGNAITDEFGFGSKYWIEPVIDIYDPTPGLPADPGEGDRYIASATANGWTDNNIYEWNGLAWVEVTALKGLACYVLDEDEIYTFNGTSWIKVLGNAHTRLHALDSTSDHSIGSLTTNYVVKNDGSKLVNSQIFDNGTNVGIGGVPVANKLEVSGTDVAVASKCSSGGGANFTIERPAGYQGNFWLKTGSLGRWKIGVNGDAESGSNAGSNLVVNRRADDGSSIADALIIKRDTGFVGINCTPTVSLHTYLASGNVFNKIETGSANTAATVYKSTVREYQAGLAAGGVSGSYSLYDVTGTTVRFHIDTSGNMGLGNGITSPAARLDVETLSGKLLKLARTSGGTYNGNIVFPYGDQYPCQIFRSGEADKSQFLVNANSGSLYIDTVNCFYWRYGINGTMIMTLLGNNGNLGIGEVSPDLPLHITRASGNRVGIKLEQETVAAWRIGIAASTAQLRFDYTNNDFSTPVMTLTSSGNLTLAAISHATSDTDKFLVSDSGELKYRTGAEVLLDIGVHDRLHALDSTSDHSIGSLTNNYLLKNDGSKLVNSQIYDNGTNLVLGIGGTYTDVDVNCNLVMLGVTQGDVFIAPGEIDFYRSTNGNAAGYINKNGYAGSTTQYRDLYICDGKGSTVMFFDGSSKNVGVGTGSPLGITHWIKSLSSNPSQAIRLNVGNPTASSGTFTRDNTVNPPLIIADKGTLTDDGELEILLEDSVDDSFYYEGFINISAVGEWDACYGVYRYAHIFGRIYMTEMGGHYIQNVGNISSAGLYDVGADTDNSLCLYIKPGSNKKVVIKNRLGGTCHLSYFGVLTKMVIESL